ncbi:MAG TPA: hypothetical protein VH137_06880, partial [Gemmatimonadales bacterium]|nr:hypothetical protein [Gemmatimonadales bacterium]
MIEPPRSFRSLRSGLLLAAMAGACAPQPWPEPPPVDQTTFLTEHAAWHAKVQQRERDEFVGLAGLWPLTAGRTPFGTDSSLPIVLPGPGP